MTDGDPHRVSSSLTLSTTEPAPAYWRDRAAYDERLERDVVNPLAAAARVYGRVPRSLQIEALERLQWYFTVDARPRAPTLIVDDLLAERFHERVSEAMRFIDVDAIAELSKAASIEVRHALLSYKKLDARSNVCLDAYDHDQRLARLTYWVHDSAAEERFIIDDEELHPAYVKNRACKYFRRTLLRQRIVWLPVGENTVSLQVCLDGDLVAVALGEHEFFALHSPASEAPREANRLLAEARSVFSRGKAGAGRARAKRGWKARVLTALAGLPIIRSRFRDAWVFADREHDADDSGEHLYRWVRARHPEINAWFLLQPGTPDWLRLQSEGFRLMPPGLSRKLLLLNSLHIASSHPDYALGKFDRSTYGDAMRWRFTYLKHGVVANDQSHYYARQDFDCIIAPSPPEFDAFVADDTPYAYTRREVRLVNLPRHDALLQRAQSIAPDQATAVVVMPTWRNSLVDDRFDALSDTERMQRMRESNYVRSWSGVLADPTVRDLLRAHGKTLVFLPHSNLLPYLDAFDLPAHVTVAAKDGVSIQQHLANCCAFVTDYTSVAFDVALLRRGVFYYQFDKDRFYGGEHNWRPGYFDYERDGFGPVATAHDDLVVNLREFFARGGRPIARHLANMERALPNREINACAGVFEAMLSLRRSYSTRDDRATAGERT